MKYASGKYFAQICGEIVPKVVYQRTTMETGKLQFRSVFSLLSVAFYF